MDTETELIQHPSCRRCGCFDFSVNTYNNSDVPREHSAPTAYHFLQERDPHCICDCHTAFDRIVLGIPADVF